MRGERGDEPDLCRLLVRRNPLPCSVDDGRLVQLRVGGHRVGHHGFAPAFVGNSEHRQLLQARQVGHGRLHLGRVHVHPARDDHVCGAVGDIQVTGIVEAADVAGVQPAVSDGRGGEVRPAEITDELGVGPHRDLPGFPGGQDCSVRTDDADVRQVHRTSAAGVDVVGLAARRPVLVLGPGDGGAGLGHAVRLDVAGTDGLDHRTHCDGRHLRAGMHCDPQGVENLGPALDLVGEVQRERRG